MKETKVYINKMPKWYSECPCNYDTYCQLHELNHYGEDNYHCKSCFDKRPKDCPLIDIKTYDRELVKEVCEDLTKSILNLKYVNDTREFATYVLSIIKSKQKDFEK